MSIRHRQLRARLAWMLAMAATLAALGVAAGPGAAQAADVREPPAPRLRLDKLFDDMRAYCMADVCAGMTIAQLSRVEGAELVLDRPLIGDKLCNSRQQQSINGTFIGRDGTRFDITFYMIPGPGEAQDLYRVVTVDLRLVGITEGELDAMATRLVERMKLSRQGDLWLGPRHDLLEVSLSRQIYYSPTDTVSQLKLIVAPTGPFAYVANQPWCQGDPVPPLLGPRPPLPVL